MFKNSMNVTLYGIPNCDQVKKARSWLSEHQIDVHFHDFKKAGITSEIIQSWLQQVDWQILLNRKGTTWRKLTEQEQAAVTDQTTAIACMVQQSSLIKRPVLVCENQTKIVVGFSEPTYRHLAQLVSTS